MEENNQQERFTSPVFKLEDLIAAIQNPGSKSVVINGTPLESIQQKTENEDKASEAKGLLIVFLFIAAIIGMVVFSQTERLLCFPCFGILLLVIGISAVRQTKLCLDNAPVLIFPTVGFLLTAIPLVMYYQKKHPGALPFINITTDTVINLCIFLIGVGGVLVTVLPILNHSLKMKRCSQVIDAQCIYRTFRTESSQKAGGRHRHYNIYSPTWQYEVNGRIYVTTENTYTSNNVPKIGDHQEIRYDPAEPDYIYRPLTVKKAAPLIIGTMMMLMGFGVFIARVKHII